jgi:nicotinamidase-related amidase
VTREASVSADPDSSRSSRGHCWDDVVSDTDLRVYRAYERERSFGRRPALVLVDLYNRAFGDRREPLLDAIERFPSSCGEAAWDALEPLEALLATARAAGHPIVHTTNENRVEAVLGRVTQRRARVDDEWGSTIVDPLTPIEDELVVYKTRASAFFDTPLSTHLRRLGVDTVVMGGESTSGCVRATAVDAYSHGLEVVIVEEATFDRIEISHKVNLFDLHHKYATVVHLQEALEYLDQTASSVEQEARRS